MKETIFKVLVKASNVNHGAAKKGKLHRRKSSTYLISFLSIESSTSLKDMISYIYLPFISQDFCFGEAAEVLLELPLIIQGAN
jgi:hypothetical protein